MTLYKASSRPPATREHHNIEERIRITTTLIKKREMIVKSHHFVEFSRLPLLGFKISCRCLLQVNNITAAGGVFVPLAWIFSQLGEIMTHLILCNFMCLVTSRRPMTRRRLDLALLGSFWYTRSWKRTSSCSSRVTLSSISLLSTWLQYLMIKKPQSKGQRREEMGQNLTIKSDLFHF